MQDFEQDKEFNQFMKHIEFMRGYFKDGEWVEIAKPKHIHEEGITRKEAELLYEKECRRKDKSDSLPGRIMSAITQRPLMTFDEEYKSLLDLMDILQKDFIDDKDLDNVLSDSESFYHTSYLNSDDVMDK